MCKIFFLKNHTQDLVEKLVPEPFIKKSKFSIFLDPVWDVIKVVFIYVQCEVYQNILKLSCWPLALTLNKASLKHQK